MPNLQKQQVTKCNNENMYRYLKYILKESSYYEKQENNDRNKERTKIKKKRKEINRTKEIYFEIKKNEKK